MSQGEQADVEDDVAQAMQKEDDADEEQDVIEPRCHVLRPEVQKGAEGHPLDAYIRRLPAEGLPEDEAMPLIDRAFREFEVGWTVRDDPVIRALVDRERLKEMTAWLDEHVMAYGVALPLVMLAVLV